MTSAAVLSQPEGPVPETQPGARSPRQGAGSPASQAAATSAPENSTSGYHPEERDSLQKGESKAQDAQEKSSGRLGQQQSHDGTTVHRGGKSHFPLDPVVNFLFGLIMSTFAVLAAAGIARISLPPQHPFQEYIGFILDHAPRLGLSGAVKVTPFLVRAAEASREAGYQVIANYLDRAIACPHTESLFVYGFTTLAFLPAVVVGWGLWRYKKEREIEVSPPQHMFCSNTMTPEQFADRRFTYEALAQLMKDPDFLKLKAQRAIQGSEAWNWQKRVREHPEEEEDASEEGESDDEQDGSN
ncbi:hypothetical protein BESB_056340 [Besnoitia besnoiti]|uniref:Transmembrane protein n=1 Tax=Besnoitia besnoiti TaxID=94643 RepID=A0A2A9MJZ5_BESBE|nr:hypothetical protein BESB_056340 [Besnoitia besnoiti]PFH35983.1 hypothetical protein BESB_056340 [Besnoitia besnoiti]